MGFPGVGIPYIPTFGHVGETIRQLAPQAAIQYLHLAWEALNNATRRLSTRVVLLDPLTRELEALAREQAALLQERQRPVPKGTEAPQEWGALGDMVFTVLTGPTSLEVQDGVSYARLPVFGEKPRLQFTGHELQELRLPIQWNHQVHADIEGALKILLEAMRERTILDLVRGDSSGSGLYAGKYVIQRISRQETHFRPDGRIAAVELTLELLEWVEDPDLVMGPPAPAVRKGQGTTKATPAVQAETHIGPDGQVVVE